MEQVFLYLLGAGGTKEDRAQGKKWCNDKQFNLKMTARMKVKAGTRLLIAEASVGEL